MEREVDVSIYAGGGVNRFIGSLAHGCFSVQLFGDTMNTAARMEHTGLRDRIQISQATTDLLLAGGKSSWIIPREELVHAKGKGKRILLDVALSLTLSLLIRRAQNILVGYRSRWRKLGLQYT